MAYRKSSRLVGPRSILLIRPDHLGDMLFLTPALHALRQALPAARITLLGGPWGVEAVRHNPDLDAIETCVFPGFERQPKENGLAPDRLLAATACEIGRRRRRHRSGLAVRSLVGRLAGGRGRHPAGASATIGRRHAHF